MAVNPQKKESYSNFLKRRQSICSFHNSNRFPHTRNYSGLERSITWTGLFNCWTWEKKDQVQNLVMFIRAGIFILIYLGELVFWKNSFMPRVKSIPINVAGRRIIISFNISPYLSITLLVFLNLFLAYLCILCPKSVVQ